MIQKMKKYHFVLHHADYNGFLKDLQNLGVVHIIRNVDTPNETQVRQLELVSRYTDAIKVLKKADTGAEKSQSSMSTKAILDRVEEAVRQIDELNREEDILNKHIRDLSPWGHFDQGLEAKLEAAGVKVDFHTCTKNNFDPRWQEDYTIIKINEIAGIVYFVVLYLDEKPELDCDTFNFHKLSLKEYENQLAQCRQKVADIRQYLEDIAAEGISRFQEEIAAIMREHEYEDATQQATAEADDHLKVLAGWIPTTKVAELDAYLNENSVIHFSEDAKPEDSPPVQLRNNWFASLFEPIGKMYMLPHYNEFDLTPFFAPFFMLFFGFCNADLAYGLVFIALGIILRYKAKNQAAKKVMDLVIMFGVSSVIMGLVMGTMLAYDLKETFLNPAVLVRNNDQIFNLALLLGVIQILFGVGINVVKKTVQFGWKHSLAPLGTFLFIASLAVLGSEMLKADISAIKPILPYTLYGGLALMMLFNQPGKNPIINILSGLWLLYNVVGGFFGDILSYIRLFALGVSSGILGYVINSIGSQFLDVPVAGPVVFVIFMIIGHSLNIALGALSGFVHPMRLTFVEFFNNADFQGPGMEYKPFGQKQ